MELKESRLVRALFGAEGKHWMALPLKVILGLKRDPRANRDVRQAAVVTASAFLVP